MKTKLPLLIPVENQVREFDPKLLLACIAAKRGFSSVIGSRREMEFRIASFPRSIYLSKSMTIRSALLFKVAHKVDHNIVAWDEEALVHLPPETYFSDRLSPVAMQIRISSARLGTRQRQFVATIFQSNERYSHPHHRKSAG